ncbi:MAG: undecaprenyl diphosphate synthase family protein, partial [Chloroflexota bacterium]
MPESFPTVSQSAPRERAAGVPRHVAIIMDGNGRWATSRSQPREAGHRAGTENVRAVITRLHERGVEYVT